MKPIDTIYNSYRFRSRLEARWAIFFDTLDVKYEYEKEGFDIDGIWYLPDFYLPDYSCWVEIKPNAPLSKKENIKINAFAKVTPDQFLLISGIPKAGFGNWWDLSEGYHIKILSIPDFPKDWTRENFVFALARRAKNPELWLLSESIGLPLINNSTDNSDRMPIVEGLEKAYNAAIQARFEGI